MNISGHTIGNKARPQILRRLIATAIQYFSKPRLIVRFGLMLIQNLTVEIHSLYRIVLRYYALFFLPASQQSGILNASN